MIKLEQSILVNADQQLCWAFMSDLSRSLTYNRFHIEILTEAKTTFSKGSKFEITHNFGFGNYNLDVEVMNWKPPSNMKLKEQHREDPDKGFPHKVSFVLSPKNNKTEIHYTLEGTYGNRVQDVPFKPILKGVMVEELFRIKQAIESSVSSELPLESGSFRTI